jgi:general secretion pathway protein K
LKKGAMLKKSQRGIAILITLFSIMIMTFLALEIAYNSQVEYAVSSSQLDQLRAYYLAKTGIQFSLLRINIYKKVMSQFGAQLGPTKSQLDLIWQFPFVWPPILPPEMSPFDKDNIEKAVKKSYIEGQFATGIESESGKIDINDLASPVPALAKAVNAQLVEIIQNRLNENDEWSENHRSGTRPQEIVNNIADWVSPGNDSLNGGSKLSNYPSSNSLTGQNVVPTSRPLKTISELHMVKGVTEDIYNLLLPRITIYGAKGINVNSAKAEVLQSIDKVITKEVAAKIVEHRSADPSDGGGPFSSVKDLTDFLNKLGVNTQTFNQSPAVPLLFDSEFVFRIKSTGIYKHAQREIIAIVYDFDKVKGQLSTALTNASSSTTVSQANSSSTVSTTGSVTTTTTQASAGATTGPPTIIFWQEF